MNVVANIREALARAAQSLELDIPASDIPLEHTDDFTNGDYASGIALSRAKAAGMPPKALAEKIVAALGAIDGVESIAIAGPGFINFFLAPKIFAEDIGVIHTAPEAWGKGDALSEKRIMMEYTDPNPFKEFHIGHLMSNAIGESIARLLESSGAEVYRVNYQGDVGPHVAKAIWGIKKLGIDAHESAALGKAYAEGAQAYESDPKAKEEIDVINARVYDKSDTEVNKLYTAGRKASLKHFEELYKMLGTKFDHYFFESETAPRGIALVRSHADVFEQSDGAIVYKGEQEGLHTRVFITSKGLPTYETKDLGLAEMKTEVWPFDTSITITAHEQADYFRVVLAAMNNVLPAIAPKIRHVSHGMMRFAEGKMSSRTGNVITGESLLHDLKEAAFVRAAETRANDKELLAEKIAVGAIKYQILRQASGKDIIFDRDHALSLDGDSGPYLQYTHARTAQVVAKARAEGVTSDIHVSTAPIELVRLVHRFPEIVAHAAALSEPHVVAQFLIELAAAFNRWYAQVHIVDGTAEAPHKVAIADAVRVTLQRGLWILGIAAPEKM
jgi:arginyl-tRNA synthetase